MRSATAPESSGAREGGVVRGALALRCSGVAGGADMVLDTGGGLFGLAAASSRAGEEAVRGTYFSGMALPEASLISSQDLSTTAFTLSGMGT